MMEGGGKRGGREREVGRGVERGRLGEWGE